VEISGQLSNRRQRDQYLSALLSGSRDIDAQLTEAVKVIVMLAAINAHENFISGVDVSSPVIVWQMFGCMSSRSAEMFFHEHINRDTAGTILGEDKVSLLSNHGIYRGGSSQAHKIKTKGQSDLAKAAPNDPGHTVKLPCDRLTDMHCAYR